jgi:hypothetical protein
MHLVYMDESGNSGLNLNDPQQPVFVLCAMIVDEQNWQPLEAELQAVLDARVPTWRTVTRFEVHAADLRRGTGFFDGVKVADRIAFRDEWMNVAAKHGIRLIHRSVYKKPYSQWLAQTFGQGVVINPHIAAFATLAPCVDAYLQSLPGKPRGMFISDENKQVMADVEKSIRVLRAEVGTMRMTQIIEKGFFIDSSKSHPLQLCDLFSLSLRKAVERELGCCPPKSIDDSGIALAKALLHEDDARDADALAWIRGQNGAKK